MMTNRPNGTLYTGVTSNIIQRTAKHKAQNIKGFTKKYNLDTLIWYELHDEMESAIIREKRIKEWKREWKIELIEKMNPSWKDLYSEITGTDSVS